MKVMQRRNWPATALQVFLVLSAIFFMSFQLAHADVSVNATFYAPGAGNGRMQGTGIPSQADADGKSNTTGALHTLDDVRLGNSPYVTLAASKKLYGNWYCMGTITYTSKLDNMVHTLQNVVGYVHDTGCVFNPGTKCTVVNQNQLRYGPNEFDIPVGLFTGWGDGQAAQFVNKNKHSYSPVWQQIAGLPSASQSTSGSQTACGGKPQESGTPTAAAYIPSNTQDAAPSPFTASPYAGSNIPGAYCLISAEPIIVVQAGTVPSSRCLNQPYTGTLSTTQNPLAPVPPTAAANPVLQSQPANTAAQTQSQTQSTTQSASSSAPVFNPAALLIVQPQIVAQGNPVLVAWTSVGMSTQTTCQVSQDGASVGQGNEGSAIIPTSSIPSGPLSFTLSCTSAAGATITQSASTTVQ
jgi:hypothetical protein